MNEPMIQHLQGLSRQVVIDGGVAVDFLCAHLKV